MYRKTYLHIYIAMCEYLQNNLNKYNFKINIRSLLSNLLFL